MKRYAILQRWRDASARRSRLRHALIAFPTTIALACSGVDIVKKEALTGLSTNTASLQLTEGTTATLTAIPVTADAAVRVTYTWASSANDVAMVSATGLVTAVAPGSATVTVTASGSGADFLNSQRTATVAVTVVPASPALTGFTVTPAIVSLQQGSTQSLTPQAATAGVGVDVTYSYASSATGVATVSSAGVVTAVAAGSATVTVTATGSGGGFKSTQRTATVPVTVIATPPALTGLTVTPASVSLQPGGTQTLTPQATTGGAGVVVTYGYSSSNLGVATVSAVGLVTGVSAGDATITITATGAGAGFTTAQRTATVSISVTAAALGMGFGDAQFASIASGSFQMGSTSGPSNERPVRTVTISQPFRMQRTEVTQAQWRQVMQGTGLENPSAYVSCGDTCPVERVSWSDIQQFLSRLNQQDPGKNYRLPTEAEWEYAARAGTTGDYGGNGVLDDMGWWVGNGGSSRKVAQKLENAWGLFDMHGSVWEWVEDCVSEYPSTPETNPRRTSCPATTDRVLRGGSFFTNATFARSAFRYSFPPSVRISDLGFRLARTP